MNVGHSRISVHSRSDGIDYMPSIVLRRVGGAPMPQRGVNCAPQEDNPWSNSRVSSLFSLASLLQQSLPQGVRSSKVATELGTEKEGAMLWTIAVILLVLWALGMVSSYTVGGAVHLLLVIALIVVVFQFISGRRSV